MYFYMTFIPVRQLHVRCLLVCPMAPRHLILHSWERKTSLWRWTDADLRRPNARAADHFLRTWCEDTKQQAQLFVLMESTNRTKECIYTQQRSARHSWLPEALSNPTPVSVSCSELPPISSREKLCGSWNSAGISWRWSLWTSSQLNLIILTVNVNPTKKSEIVGVMPQGRKKMMWQHQVYPSFTV